MERIFLHVSCQSAGVDHLYSCSAIGQSLSKKTLTKTAPGTSNGSGFKACAGGRVVGIALGWACVVGAAFDGVGRDAATVVATVVDVVGGEVVVVGTDNDNEVAVVNDEVVAKAIVLIDGFTAVASSNRSGTTPARRTTIETVTTATVNFRVMSGHYPAFFRVF